MKKYKICAVILALCITACGCVKPIPENTSAQTTAAVSSKAPAAPAPKTSTSTAAATAAKTTAQTTAETKPAYDVERADRSRFSERMSEIYSQYSVMGMSVAIFKNGEIVHTENLGYADKANGIKCGDDTHYRIASVSKLVSTMLLMDLCEEKNISIYDNLDELTGLPYSSPYCENKVQLHHLLTHTSGLADTYLYEQGAWTYNSAKYIMQYSRSGYEPGEEYIYCNFGSGTIGAITERLTDKYFWDYAEECFFEPLGMDAGYIIDCIDDKKSCANCYDYDGAVYKVKSWGRNRRYYTLFGKGNSYMSAQCELIITASDLARLGIALAGDGTCGGKRVLSENAVRLMNTSYLSTENYDMGLNVRIYDSLIDGRTIYGHPGNALGCINGIFYDPSDQSGVVILTNRCYSAENEENGMYEFLHDVLTEAYECYLDI